jgi:hypothetical protein
VDEFCGNGWKIDLHNIHELTVCMNPVNGDFSIGVYDIFNCHDFFLLMVAGSPSLTFGTLLVSGLRWFVESSWDSNTFLKRGSHTSFHAHSQLGSVCLPNCCKDSVPVQLQGMTETHPELEPSLKYSNHEEDPTPHLDVFVPTWTYFYVTHRKCEKPVVKRCMLTGQDQHTWKAGTGRPGRK